MSDRLYMPGIYRPDLHTALHETGSLLNFVRELNFKYGVKVASPISSFSQMDGRSGVMLSYPSGMNAAMVWFDKSEDSIKFYSPFFKKQRGANDDDRSIISAKSIKRMMGLIDKYDALKSNEHLSKNALKVVESMINLTRLAVKSNYSSGHVFYGISDEFLRALALEAAKNLPIDSSEIPNGQNTKLDLQKVKEVLKEFQMRDEHSKEVSTRVRELIEPEMLLVGLYAQSANNASHGYAPRAGEHLAVACIVKISPDEKPIITKEFQPIYSFNDLLDKFPEAMPQLVATKMRVEDELSGTSDTVFMDFVRMRDVANLDIPYASYYYKITRFDCQWFATPIRRNV